MTSDNSQRSIMNRLLQTRVAATFAAPLGGLGAQALVLRTVPRIDFSEFSTCRTASKAPPLSGLPRKLRLSWNAGAVCLTPVPVAIDLGFFQKQHLEVELVNYSGSTDRLGMALGWLKPLDSAPMAAACA